MKNYWAKDKKMIQNVSHVQIIGIIVNEIKSDILHAERAIVINWISVFELTSSNSFRDILLFSK